MKAESILNESISVLSGVGDKLKQKLATLNITTIGDLIFHLPLRYENHTKIQSPRNATLCQPTNISGTITNVNSKFTRKGPMVICTIKDKSNTPVDIIFWNLYPSQQRNLVFGKIMLAFGCISTNNFGGYTMQHPSYKLFNSYDEIELPKELTPIYPQVAGLTSEKISKLVQLALTLVKNETLDDLFPVQVSNLKIFDCLTFIHNPPVDTDMQQLENFETPQQQRLILEELVAQTVSVLQAKVKNNKFESFKIKNNGHLLEVFLANLPYKPTNAQRRVISEIASDMAQKSPMMRLLQGDVGSGKTMVAAASSLNVIEMGYQVVLMAPTEILAEQHYKNIKSMFEDLGIEIAYLSGKQKTKEKKEESEKIASGKALFVIGTHALFQNDITFKNLALVLIDEQHRFGVEQRLKLLQKGAKENKLPHQLIMTATPIPRTLAMTNYADLAVSTIDEMPPGRKQVKTSLITYAQKDKLIERLNDVCSTKKWQIYWVCTLIEKSESLEDCAAAEEVEQELQQYLPNLKIKLVHGKLPQEEKQTIMQEFKDGKVDLLVATTVIEVGVDVPNANIIIIENPERLGLAQLHQLRGRVGRGQEQAFCILFCKNQISDESYQRLNFLKNNYDGLKIAEHDLSIRGPGEYVGTKQTGISTMKIANFVRDQKMIPEANAISHTLINKYPEYCEKLIKRWLNNNQNLTNA